MDKDDTAPKAQGSELRDTLLLQQDSHENTYRHESAISFAVEWAHLGGD